jgi:photosystem II stability/assembly factor-like uncharacterized protein
MSVKSFGKQVLAIPIATLLLLFYALVPPALAQYGAWQPIGPPGGNVISLAIAPDRTVYLGAADGHIFASHDAGQHWSLRGRVSSRHDAVIQKLLVDASDQNHLLAAVWFQDVQAGGALFHSSDAGVTWTLAGLSGEIVRTVEQSPGAAKIFVAGTRSGVFRSTDAAQTWRRISPAGDPELRNVDSVAIDPRDPNIIYAGTYHLPWKTIDAGKTWNAIAAGMIDDSDVMSLRVDSTSPGRIFASACSGIYRSENGGAAWTKLQGIPYSSRRTQAIVQDPADARVLYAATTEGLWVTRDGGESWMRTTPREWVVNDVIVLPPSPANSGNSSQQILLGTEAQGVLASSDAGVTFTPVNDGFSHRITAALLGDPQDAQHLLAWMPGSPDALIESHDGGLHWQTLPGPLSTDATPAQLAHIFSSDIGWWIAGANGALWVYEAPAGKWMPLRFASIVQRVGGPPRGSSSRVTPPRALSPQAGSSVRRGTVVSPAAGADISDLRTMGARVFVATSQGLWSGTIGEKILRPVTAATNFETVSAEPGRRIWMVAGGKVWQSLDEGKSWRQEHLDIAPEVPDADLRWIRELNVSRLGITDALASAQQGSRLLVAATAKGLYRRADGAQTWQLVANGLAVGEPISYFFGDALWLIAIRDGGLYASRDGAQTWERIDCGVVTGQFTGVAVSADGTVVAASLTEGLLRLPAPRID